MEQSKIIDMLETYQLPWRDWQPLYRVGCEVLVCLCRCVGLLRSLLLDWDLGSQKLREILTLLCCITLSSSREKTTHAQEVARRISGAVAGESTHKSRHTKYPSQTLIPRITLFSIFLSFSSPPLLKRFSETFAFSSHSSRMSFCLCFHVPSICLHLCLLKIYWYGST